MRRRFEKVSTDGKPEIWLGANFWSRTGGPLMWRSYDPDVAAAELRVLREHGLGITRSFFYWPDFMPEPGRIDEDMARRYADFLDRHAGEGMRTIPTFIVGHMSGENWDPAWRGGRDLYRDVWMVGRQAWFIREMAARYKDHPAVAAWLISNEMPIYGGPAETEVVSAWAEIMVQAVRAAGATQPVSLGDGAWGIEVTGTDNGYSVREIAGLVDFIGPHVYRMDNDVVRQHLNAAFACELSAFGGTPVVLEEFGCSTDFASSRNAGHYYRQVLHTSLLAGATGWIAWNNTDYDHLAGQDPYRHHPFEMHFGITDARGRPKEPLREMRVFADVLEKVDLAGCEREPAEAAIVVPSYLETGYPFTRPEDRAYIFGVLRQSYVAAREADLRAALLREADGLAGGAKLYLVPSAKQLTAPSWHRLAELADGGAVVYVSYGAGDHGFQRGPWYANLNELFGVEHQLMYGLAEPVDGGEVRWTFRSDFGSLRAGETLSFRAGGNEHSRTYLPVEVTDADVLAVDQHSRPALVRREAGRGAVVLSTYPLEHMAAANARVNPEATWRIYDALADAAGVCRPVTVADPRVLADGLVHVDGRRFVWLVSECGAELTVVPAIRGGGKLADLATGAVSGEVTLPPYGVRVMLLQEPAAGE